MCISIVIFFFKFYFSCYFTEIHSSLILGIETFTFDLEIMIMRDTERKVCELSCNSDTDLILRFLLFVTSQNSSMLGLFMSMQKVIKKKRQKPFSVKMRMKRSELI